MDGGHAALLEIDVADTSDPKLVSGHAELGGGGCASTEGSHFYHLRPETRSLTIRDLTRPESLPELSSIRIPMGQGCAVAVDRPLLLASEAEGIGIFDIGDPSQAKRLGHLPMEGVVRDILVHDQVVLVAAEEEGLGIFDISDPTAPQTLSRLDTPGQASALAIHQSVLYLADGEAGLAMIDIDDPRTPELRQKLPLGGSALSLVAGQEQVYVGLRYPEAGRGRSWLPELITIQPGASPEIVHRLVLEPWPKRAALALDPDSDHLFVSSGFGIRSLDVSGTIPLDLGQTKAGDGADQLVFSNGTLIGLEWNGIRVMNVE